MQMFSLLYFYCLDFQESTPKVNPKMSFENFISNFFLEQKKNMTFRVYQLHIHSGPKCYWKNWLVEFEYCRHGAIFTGHHPVCRCSAPLVILLI